ncbi:MAG TPA: orotate phosphoribosyltransferase, partial [Anaerolineales bacterium]|nr:orotate phosphoribosyltransferase [Anaerolineales bacterium]
DLWILAPGVGAQGGDLRAALQAGLRADGLGMLIPVSRGISRAENPGKAAQELRDTINRERAALAQTPLEPRNSFAMLADALLDAGCIRFGRFTLKSGIESPIYIDLRRLVGYPELMAAVADAYSHILRGLTFDHLAALPYAALPIAAAISLRGGWPMIYPRKEVKSYGTKAAVEGVFQPGERAVVLDDLISTGGSKFEGIEKLEAAGLKVSDVVVLIDRRPAGQNELAERGYRLHAVLTLPDLLAHYERSGALDAARAAEVLAFLSG